MARRVYWDSCTFLGLLNIEADKHAECMQVWKEAQRGLTIIQTSFFTYTEVFKAKCEGPAKPLDEAGDKQIEALLQQPFIQGVLVDESLGIAARRLMRRHPECKKPSDAVHLATAQRLSVDEMHTFDGSDLLGLDGLVMCANSRYLTICRPRPIPPPPAPLLEAITKTDEDAKKAS